MYEEYKKGLRASTKKKIGRDYDRRVITEVLNIIQKTTETIIYLLWEHRLAIRTKTPHGIIVGLGLVRRLGSTVETHRHTV